AIAEFIRARAMDEAGAAGRMQYFQQNGGTIQPRIPKSGSLAADSAGQRAKVKGWLEEHTPDRFMAMASELAHMADGLAEAQAGISAVSDVHAKYSARAAWRRVTRAARLWEAHPDFDPAWAKDEDAES
ncbi:hypothetical protein, partial [Streptomyces sp. NPDC001492]